MGVGGRRVHARSRSFPRRWAELPVVNTTRVRAWILQRNEAGSVWTEPEPWTLTEQNFSLKLRPLTWFGSAAPAGSEGPLLGAGRRRLTAELRRGVWLSVGVGVAVTQLTGSCHVTYGQPSRAESPGACAWNKNKIKILVMNLRKLWKFLDKLMLNPKIYRNSQIKTKTEKNKKQEIHSLRFSYRLGSDSSGVDRWSAEATPPIWVSLPEEPEPSL